MTKPDLDLRFTYEAVIKKTEPETSYRRKQKQKNQLTFHLMKESWHYNVVYFHFQYLTIAQLQVYFCRNVPSSGVASIGPGQAMARPLDMIDPASTTGWPDV